MSKQSYNQDAGFLLDCLDIASDCSSVRGRLGCEEPEANGNDAEGCADEDDTKPLLQFCVGFYHPFGMCCPV